MASIRALISAVLIAPGRRHVRDVGTGIVGVEGIAMRNLPSSLGYRIATAAAAWTVQHPRICVICFTWRGVTCTIPNHRPATTSTPVRLDVLLAADTAQSFELPGADLSGDELIARGLPE